MRFYVGIINILISITVLGIAIVFLDYSILFEKLFGVLCFVISAMFLYSAIWNLNVFYKNKRVKLNGIQVKAKILNINRTILSVKNSPEFIIEVSYVHPSTQEKYQIFVDAYDKNFDQRQDQIDHSVQILVDPKDPTSAQLVEHVA